MTNNDDLEYNDGLGDLLREKEQHEFSWSKTTIVLLIVVFGIFVALTLAFNFSKNLLTDSPAPAPLLNEPAGEAFQEKVAAIQKEQNNLDLIQKLESSLEKADKKAGSLAKKPATPASLSKESAKQTSSPSAVATYFRVYTGAFDDYDNAKAALVTVQEAGLEGFIKATIIDDVKKYRVQVAAYTKKEQADNYVTILDKKGFSAYISTH